uniref:Uncharacterized protein n=1 Tax=Anguilla anguilla TaxID=7936 RepID=A0A0E9W688_ANGAN
MWTCTKRHVWQCGNIAVNHRLYSIVADYLLGRGNVRTACLEGSIDFLPRRD